MSNDQEIDFMLDLGNSVKEFQEKMNKDEDFIFVIGINRQSGIMLNSFNGSIETFIAAFQSSTFSEKNSCDQKISYQSTKDFIIHASAFFLSEDKKKMKEFQILLKNLIRL